MIIAHIQRVILSREDDWRHCISVLLLTAVYHFGKAHIKAMFGITESKNYMT